MSSKPTSGNTRQGIVCDVSQRVVHIIGGVCVGIRWAGRCLSGGARSGSKQK